MTEVQANLMFGNFRQGQRYEVDIHDPVIRGLVKAGYLKIIWKAASDAAGTLDLGGAGDVPGDGVGVGMVGPSQEEEKKPAATPRGSGKKTTVSGGKDQTESDEGDFVGA